MGYFFEEHKYFKMIFVFEMENTFIYNNTEKSSCLVGNVSERKGRKTVVLCLSLHFDITETKVEFI